MSMSGPGKSYRKGITLIDAVKKFDTEEKAETWFLEQRWSSGVACPFCGTLNVAAVASRKPQPFPLPGKGMLQVLLRQDGNPAP